MEPLCYLGNWAPLCELILLPSISVQPWFLLFWTSNFGRVHCQLCSYGDPPINITHHGRFLSLFSLPCCFCVLLSCYLLSSSCPTGEKNRKWWMKRSKGIVSGGGGWMWTIGLKTSPYFFIGKLFLLPGKITRAKHANPVSCLKGCQMPQMILVGLFNSAKVSTLGIFFRIQRPKSEAHRGELFFQDSRCVCETTRYGANWFHPWETGDFSKLCLWSWLMQFPISPLKCALINSNIKATK